MGEGPRRWWMQEYDVHEVVVVEGHPREPLLEPDFPSRVEELPVEEGTGEQLPARQPVSGQSSAPRGGPGIEGLAGLGRVTRRPDSPLIRVVDLIPPRRPASRPSSFGPSSTLSPCRGPRRCRVTLP